MKIQTAIHLRLPEHSTHADFDEGFELQNSELK